MAMEAMSRSLKFSFTPQKQNNKNGDVLLKNDDLLVCSTRLYIVLCTLHV